MAKTPEEIVAEIQNDRGKWGECDKYPRADWISEVSDGLTQRGYWDWVTHLLEVDEEVEDS